MWRIVSGTLIACVLAAVTVVEPVAAAPMPAADAAPTSTYVPLEPCRLLDTRVSAGTRAAPGLTMTVSVTGRCGVPAGAVAAAISVTVVDTASAGFVTAWPTDEPQPLASTVTWSRAGDTRANGAIIRLSAAGKVSIFSSAPTDVVIDVSGAFVPASTARAGRFVPMTPVRLLDTRTTSRPAAASSVDVPRPAGVPADAIALAVGITTTESSGPGYFTAYAAGSARPNASVLNTTGAGQTVASTAVVPIGDGGLSVFTQAGDHVIVDVFGWFTGPSATSSEDGLFVPATPTRVLDTRTGGVPVYTNGSVQLPLADIASGAAAVVANVTATQSRGSGFVTAFPTRTARPFVSSLNYSPGQSVANMAIIAASTSGVSLYANRTADLVVDVTGWFTGQPLAAIGGAPDSNVAPPSPEMPGCPATGRAAVGDKAAQRFWLCQDGYPITDALPMTTGGIAYFLPPVGTYKVFAKLPTNTGIHGERLYRFVAFYTTSRGNRIAFHEVVNQRPETVGDLNMRGASSGCFRLRRDDSIRVWDFLQIGDPVVIITP
ncbi:MAG: L,D-transpeptidase [Ilumatobacteraceae bacterium]